jgi:hypothetical protein
VRTAAERARPGDVVLLAPACSSFDQFENFEHRGRVFKALVERLAEESSRKSSNRMGHRVQIVAGPGVQAAGGPAVLPADQPALDRSIKSSGQQDADGDQRVPVSIEPEHLVLTAPRELEYVYEVSAEEASRQGLRDSGEATDELLMDEDDLTQAEPVEDEAFAYEVRAETRTGRGSADAGKDASAKINTRKRSRTHKEK